MLFHLIKTYARFAIRIYCRKIVINKPEYLHFDGPLLLAANHPNSFLDGIILTTLFEKRIYSLARGDVFKNPVVDKILRWVGLLPVFRTSEGAENLGQNYITFGACLDGFQEKKVVLIFSEGRCENEWHLRPLRKGTARLAYSSWEKGQRLTVLPVAFNYSSFKRFGKDIHINFGEPITDLRKKESYGRDLLAFNKELNRQLERLVYEIKPSDQTAHSSYFPKTIPEWKNILLWLPAFFGWLVHLPLYLPVKALTLFRFHNSGHYDSVLITTLMILYPLYLLVVFLVLLSFDPLFAVASIFILPFTAWSYAQRGFTII